MRAIQNNLLMILLDYQVPANTLTPSLILLLLSNFKVARKLKCYLCMQATMICPDKICDVFLEK